MRITLLPFLFSILSLISACSTGQGLREPDAVDPIQLRLDAAAAAIAEGDPTSGLRMLKEITRDASDRPEYHHLRALARAQKGDLSGAISDAKKAVELEPKFSEAQNTLGKLLLDQNKHAEAEIPLKKAANDPLYSDAFKAQTLLGISAYRRGDWALSKKWLQSAVRSDSGRSCMATLYLGHVAMREGKINEALQTYENSTRRFCAGFQEGHVALGVALKHAGRLDEARRTFLSIHERFPRSTASVRALQELKGIGK